MNQIDTYKLRKINTVVLAMVSGLFVSLVGSDSTLFWVVSFLFGSAPMFTILELKKNG